MSIASGENNGEAAALTQQLINDAPIKSNMATGDTVPVHVIQSMREEFQSKLRAEQEKNEAFRNHIQMSQWQQPQQQQQVASPFGNADPEDSIKVKDAMKLMSDFEQRNQAQFAELKLASKAPDYRDVIQKFLPRATQEDPELLDEIKRSANPYKTAYLAAKASQAYQDEYMSRNASKTVPIQSAQEKPRVDPEAEKIIANAKQSGNLSSVGNQATVGGKLPSFSSMTDEDFRKYKSSRLFGSKPK